MTSPGARRDFCWFFACRANGPLLASGINQATKRATCLPARRGTALYCSRSPAHAGRDQQLRFQLHHSTLRLLLKCWNTAECCTSTDCWHYPLSMRNRFYVAALCPSVRLSVRLSQHEPTAANPLLQVCCCGPGRQEISIHRCMAGAQQHRHAAGKCGQCHVVSVRSSWTRSILF